MALLFFVVFRQRFALWLSLSRLLSRVLTIAFSILVAFYLLLRHQRLCKGWLQCGGRTKLPVKISCLRSIAGILDDLSALNRSQDAVPIEKASVWSLCHRLLDALGAECRREPTMAYLTALLMQPFVELRNASSSCCVRWRS